MHSNPGEKPGSSGKVLTGERRSLVARLYRTALCPYSVSCLEGDMVLDEEG
jgi:hypothetical protein